jgi:exonuclease SbcC
MAAAYQQIQGHSSAAAEAARAEGLARQRANAAKQRLEKASRAQGGTVKLTELRERLSKAEYAVADARESLERLRGKRLSGAEERLDAAIGTLEVIAGGEEDPAGLAQERLDRNQQEVQEARNLPEEIAAYERLLREHECAVTVLARDVRTCELNAEAAKDLQPAAQELEIAQAALEDADTRRRREGEAASIATSEHEEIGKTLSALQVELLGVEPIAAKSGPLDKAETRLAELEPQVAAAKAEVARLDVALADMGPMPAWPGEPDVDGARAAATEAEQQLALARDAAARTEQQLKQAVLSRHRVLDLEEQRTAAEAELSDWTRLAADLGKDGLQAMVIDGAIPEINELTNELLHAAFGPRFTVEVRTQTADAKGKRLLETLDVFVIDTGTDQHKGREGLIETFSGGEKTILAEALSLALTRLACRLSGAERPTLIRDESAGQLSEGNAPIWMAMLRRAADLIGVDRILFVNHDRQTWELADARIEVRS